MCGKQPSKRVPQSHHKENAAKNTIISAPVTGLAVLFVDKLSDGLSVETPVDVLVEDGQTDVVHRHVTQRTDHLRLFVVNTAKCILRERKTGDPQQMLNTTHKRCSSNQQTRKLDQRKGRAIMSQVVLQEPQGGAVGQGVLCKKEQGDKTSGTCCLGANSHVASLIPSVQLTFAHWTHLLGGGRGWFCHMTP